MKEKTFKDLGLDEGDKYLEKMSYDFDLGTLEDILKNEENKNELDKKIKDIKKEV